MNHLAQWIVSADAVKVQLCCLRRQKTANSIRYGEGQNLPICCGQQAWQRNLQLAAGAHDFGTKLRTCSSGGQVEGVSMAQNAAFCWSLYLTPQLLSLYVLQLPVKVPGKHGAAAVASRHTWTMHAPPHSIRCS